MTVTLSGPTDSWELQAMRRALRALGVDFQVRSRKGSHVHLIRDGSEVLAVDRDALERVPMDVIRSTYRGLSLEPSPHAIEAAWKGLRIEQKKEVDHER